MKGVLLIIGCGSIGRRHAQNARKLGLRVSVCDSDIDRANELAEDISAEECYSDYKEALLKNGDIVAAVIATPSGFHVEQATFLAQKGIHFFMEKPLAVTMEGIDALIEITKKNKIVTMMGQSYRFHEGYLALKKMLEEEVIGRIYHVNFFSGQYLPDWHPSMDYRTEYAAQKKLGGGALLTSMSHIFDSVFWFFGDIEEIVGWKSRLSDLEMDVDDSVFCLIKTNRGIIAECQTDFLQRTSEHRMIIVGENGSIDADFVRHSLSLQVVGDEEPHVTTYAFDGNKRYVDELSHFVGLIGKDAEKHELDISMGKRIVELLLTDNIKAITKI